MPASRFLKRPLCSMLVLGLFLTGWVQASEAAENKPEIVVSIQPLALLAAEVAGDQVAIRTLINPGQSPHNFQMRPSGRRALGNADRIFWVGPELELFLQHLLEQHEFSDKTLALGEGLLTGEGQATPSSAHGSSDHDHSHSHDHGQADPHIWLDPALALTMAERMVRSLGELEQVDRERLGQRLEIFRQELADTEQKLRSELKAASGVSLFTHHDAFSRFAGHFGLEVAGSLTINPQVQPGARRVAEITGRLSQAEAPCVLVEPQLGGNWWRSVAAGANARISQWDPLASELEPVAGAYSAFLQGLGQAVLACVPGP